MVYICLSNKNQSSYNSLTILYYSVTPQCWRSKVLQPRTPPSHHHQYPQGRSPERTSNITYQKVTQVGPKYKHTVRDGGSTALKTAFTLFTLLAPSGALIAIPTHSSYYSINGGKVDLKNQLPARASPFLSMTEATSMSRPTTRGGRYYRKNYGQPINQHFYNLSANYRYWKK